MNYLNIFKKELEGTPFWDLDKIVYYFEGTDLNGVKDKFPVRIRDLLIGVLLLGQTGSGKSSSSGENLLRVGCQQDLPIFAITAKATDRDELIRIFEEEGRADDVIEFSQESGLCFDPIMFEFNRQTRGGGEIGNVVSLISKFAKLKNKGNSEAKEESYWLESTAQFFKRGFTTLRMAGHPPTLHNFRRLAVDASFSEKYIDRYNELSQKLATYYKGNSSMDELEVESVKDEMVALLDQNFLLKCLDEAWIAQDQNPELQYDYELIESYFLKEYHGHSDKTKSTIHQFVNGLIEPFLEGTLKECFTGRVDECLTLKSIIRNKSIVIINFPPKELEEVGRMAIGYYRLSIMKELERRKTDDSGNHPPVMLYQDEAQEYIDPEYDYKFQSTARSSKVITVTVSQSIYAIAHSFGKDGLSKFKNLASNMGLKIFHAQDDPDTNRYASALFSEDKKEKVSYSETDIERTKSISYEHAPLVRPIEFFRLRNGGKINNRKVDAFVVSASKYHDWHKSHVIRATFTQPK